MPYWDLIGQTARRAGQKKVTFASLRRPQKAIARANIADLTLLVSF